MKTRTHGGEPSGTRTSHLRDFGSCVYPVTACYGLIIYLSILLLEFDLGYTCYDGRSGGVQVTGSVSTKTLPRRTVM